MKKISRPLSITIICIVGWVLSLNYLFNGLITTIIILLINILPGALTQFFISFESMIVTTLSTFLLGFILIPVSILYIVSFYGLWKMKKWGWIMSLELSIFIFFLEAILGLDFTIIIELIIIYILWRNRNFFSK